MRKGDGKGWGFVAHRILSLDSTSCQVSIPRLLGCEGKPSRKGTFKAWNSHTGGDGEVCSTSHLQPRTARKERLKIPRVNIPVIKQAPRVNLLCRDLFSTAHKDEGSGLRGDREGEARLRNGVTTAC